MVQDDGHHLEFSFAYAESDGVVLLEYQPLCDYEGLINTTVYANDNGYTGKGIYFTTSFILYFIGMNSLK